MRVFIAVEISNEKILEKIQTFQKNVKIDAKPTRVDQIHFTLQFLGEINDEKCQQVQDVLNEISFSQFDISLKNVGGFPNLKNPRVIWVGLEKDGAGKLTDLANEIGTKLTKLGFEKDKKFKPHLTVFRVKKRIESVSSIMK
ncbi:MAG: RNA 2',3'-cyclic phosphodiesterase, partial [Thermoproteota archaeon]|nr:RNA 2',3'-cyclic phosphodiesterase [Thermoproteota archaeon]